MLIIKAITMLLVLGVIGSTIYLIKDYTGSVEDLPGAMMERQRMVEQKLKVKTEHVQDSGNKPGEKAFQRAKELLAEESMQEAEEKMKYIVSFYPSAECATQCRRILGEINLDRLLDPAKLEGKKVVTVRSGDTFSRIIAENKTTMDSLVHLSELKRSDHRSLHPGDKLVVMPMEMRAVIDLRRNTLTIWNGGEFIKEYTLLKVSYKSRSATKRCEIGLIRGEHDGKLYLNHAEEYRSSNKVIILSDKSLAIRSFSSDSEDDQSLGFMLSHADMEELPLLLRPGNDVEIKQ
ncbi:MAG: LysM peptidoglycan-binding domain-containing protein [Akkermansiaceae bacterium]|nr:LysM peptidoglycan-binding domain-containing protein [Akkermansiaceae bacterium]